MTRGGPARRLAGPLLTLSLLALGGAAVLDERRRVEPADRPAPAAASGPLAQRLARAGVTGDLIYTDADCRLHRLLLPPLRELIRPVRAGCLFSLAPSRGRGAGPELVWDPAGTSFARCRGRRIEIGDAEFVAVAHRLPGCPPAWRPDGVLTAVNASGIVRFTRCPRRPVTCTRLLVPGRALARAAASHPDAPVRRRWPRDVRVQSFVWLSATRFAALLDVRIGGRGAQSHRRQVLALYERGRLLRALPLRPIFSGLRASPRGSFAWARPNLLVRRDGRRLPLRGVQALAWSPGERWTALATARHVVLVPTSRLADPTARRLWLPIEARDLAWAAIRD